MTSTESQIEQDLLERLTRLKYHYRHDIRDRAALEANFRTKFEALNKVKLSDNEFSRLLANIVSGDVYQSAQNLRVRHTFERDDGTVLPFMLVNLRDWCKNDFEVVNQLRMNTANSHHRYDVILLINGLPVVQIELKALQISPRRAMEQIVTYKNDPGNGYSNSLLCFIQFFIVSNQFETLYFANNNTRHFNFHADERFLPIYKFADKDNNKINHLNNFAEHFLAKCTLGEMVSRYMVLVECEQKLMMMRPYQIYAVKEIVETIRQNCGNGYIWHTTGSGKTLTSFKAATLLKDNPQIDKCLFVVDRKDLDRQTRDEFNKFQKDCVEENTDTKSLVTKLLSNDYADKIIVTTIQKLGRALDRSNRNDYRTQLQVLRDKRFVFIFDECHRSQFGENHQAIKHFFPQAQLFGFTGTPIFDKNATSRWIDEEDIKKKYTTEDIFQRPLHLYTITHAIEDKNVLRFHIEHFGADKKKAQTENAPLPKAKIVEAILDKHDRATNQRKFNALFATNCINDAIEYFEIFQKSQAQKLEQDPDFRPLNIAVVFSPPVDASSPADIRSIVKQYREDLPQEAEDYRIDPEGKKAALARIIADYNERFGTDNSLNRFDLYYYDVQTRIKNQQYPNSDMPHSQKIDITIVVDMLLTGFDSKYLSTLYVDKNLKTHGLIQAFSRTNRVLNDSKPFGNIIDFRQLEERVDEAIALFSGMPAEQSRKIWLVESAQEVIDRLQQKQADLAAFMADKGSACRPDEVYNLAGKEAKRQFITLYKEVQRAKTQLGQYTDLTEEQKQQIEQILPKENERGFKAAYIETVKQLREPTGGGDDIARAENDNLDFELVLFASNIIDYDYIMELIAKTTKAPPEKVKTDRAGLIRLIRSDPKFIDAGDDWEDYINALPVGEALDKAAIKLGIEQFIKEKRAAELADLATQYGLEASALQAFVDKVLLHLVFDGEDLTDLLEPLNLGWKERDKQELALMRDLIPLLRKRAGSQDISGLRPYEQ